MEEAQNDFVRSKQEMETSYLSQLNEIECRDAQLQKQLDLAYDQVGSLRSELNARLELLKNANEAVVIKVVPLSISIQSH